jgi:hypothetical protein
MFALASVRERRDPMRNIMLLVATVLGVACLAPPVAAQQFASDPASVRAVDELRSALTSVGFIVDEPRTWDWLTPPVSSVRVHDGATGRVLMIVIYPSTESALVARARANDGSLAAGFGDTVWIGNLALSQSTELHLSQVDALVAHRENGAFTEDEVFTLFQHPTYAVDRDFLQALGHEGTSASRQQGDQETAGRAALCAYSRRATREGKSVLYNDTITAATEVG